MKFLACILWLLKQELEDLKEEFKETIMTREPCTCGADDCPRCHPENPHTHVWRPLRDGWVRCRICGKEEEI